MGDGPDWPRCRLRGGDGTTVTDVTAVLAVIRATTGRPASTLRITLVEEAPDHLHSHDGTSPRGDEDALPRVDAQRWREVSGRSERS